MLEIFTSWIGLLAALIALLGLVFGPNAWPAMRNWYSRIYTSLLYPFKGTERRVLDLQKEQQKAYENLKSVDKKLDELIEQFKPNGGATIKDSLNRIELKQASNENITSFLINSLDVPMFKTDSNGLLIWVSKAYSEIYSSNTNDLMDWGWLTCIHNEDVDRVRIKWKHSIEEKRIFDDTYRIIGATGKITSVHAKAAPTFFNNKIAGWIGALEIIK